MRVAPPRLLAFTLLALGAGCQGDRLTTPEDAAAKSPSVAAGGRAPTDTTSPSPTVMQLSGRILGVQVVVPTNGGDSLRFEPIAGAAIQLHRNVLVNGAARQELARELTAASDGSYSVADLPGGYYVVTATPPSGSPYRKNWSYVPRSASPRVDVYLWQRE